jgi:hypothetical protein
MMHFDILSSPLLGMSGFMFCVSFVDIISPIIMATSDIVLIVDSICTLTNMSLLTQLVQILHRKSLLVERSGFDHCSSSKDYIISQSTP